METLHWAILVGGGFMAGAVNTLAGGGSLLTVPLLIWVGLPPIVANGTNRLGVLASSLTSTWRFRQEGLSGFRDVRKIIIPIALGALGGAAAISEVSNTIFEKAFAVVMVVLLIPILRRPAFLRARAEGDAVWSPTKTWIVFLAIGFYGGAVQAGIGIFLIFALSYAGYDLVKANSIKVVITAGVTLVALPVFIYQAQIAWLPGLALAAGFSVGGIAGAHWTVAGGEKLIRPILAIAVIAMAGRLLALY